MENIITKAIKVKLSISQYNPSRRDRKITNEVLEERKAGHAAGKWVKNLIDPKVLDEINSIAMQARLKHYSLSLPWQDEGWRILPITMFNQYQQVMREFNKEFQQAVERFLQKYPQYIEEAKRALNGMFNSNDYLNAAEIKTKFDFNIDFDPLPCGDDFRVTLQDDELYKMQQDVEARVKKATEQAVIDLWRRLSDPVKKMVEKLNDSDAIFRNSLVDNITEIVNLIPVLNITEDKELEKLAQECKKLTVLNPDILREDKTMRTKTAQEADKLYQKMKGYLQ